MEDDFDLDGLSASDAKVYVAGFITSQKQTTRDLEAARDELAMWKKRTSLAADRGETDLARESLSRAEEAHSKVSRLTAEKRDIDFKVEELKRRLAKVRDQPQLSVDAGALLEQLESVVGEDHETNDAIVQAEAEVALEALKRKMEEESGE